MDDQRVADYAFNASPMVRELIASFWRRILAFAAGYVAHYTIVSTSQLDSWATTTTEILTVFTLFAWSQAWSYLKLRRAARVRSQLATLVVEQKSVNEVTSGELLRSEASK